MRYLEMSGRTEVLNKRLDMLRELLDVLSDRSWYALLALNRYQEHSVIDFCHI